MAVAQLIACVLLSLYFYPKMPVDAMYPEGDPAQKVTIRGNAAGLQELKDIKEGRDPCQDITAESMVPGAPSIQLPRKCARAIEAYNLLVSKSRSMCPEIHRLKSTTGDCVAKKGDTPGYCAVQIGKPRTGPLGCCVPDKLTLVPMTYCISNLTFDL